MQTTLIFHKLTRLVKYECLFMYCKGFTMGPISQGRGAGELIRISLEITITAAQIHLCLYVNKEFW